MLNFLLGGIVHERRKSFRIEGRKRTCTRELFHFPDDNCINDSTHERVYENTNAVPLFVARRYVARQDSMIRGSADRGKAPFNAFRTDIYPALSQ